LKLERDQVVRRREEIEVY